MNVVTVTQARARLYHLVDEVSESHVPILITGKRASAVLIAQDDWKAIEETLYLLSQPGIGQSIQQGLETPMGETEEDISW